MCTDKFWTKLCHRGKVKIKLFSWDKIWPSYYTHGQEHVFHHFGSYFRDITDPCQNLCWWGFFFQILLRWNPWKSTWWQAPWNIMCSNWSWWSWVHFQGYRGICIHTFCQLWFGVDSICFSSLPWYNQNGWLGVKHQVTLLLFFFFMHRYIISDQTLQPCLCECSDSRRPLQPSLGGVSAQVLQPRHRCSQQHGTVHSVLHCSQLPWCHAGNGETATRCHPWRSGSPRLHPGNGVFWPRCGREPSDGASACQG